MKLISFFWPLLNPNHIGIIGISKWHLFDVDLESTILVPFKIEWVFYPEC